MFLNTNFEGEISSITRAELRNNSNKIPGTYLDSSRTSFPSRFQPGIRVKVGHLANVMKYSTTFEGKLSNSWFSFRFVEK